MFKEIGVGGYASVEEWSGLRRGLVRCFARCVMCDVRADKDGIERMGVREGGEANKNCNSRVSETLSRCPCPMFLGSYTRLRHIKSVRQSAFISATDALSLSCLIELTIKDPPHKGSERA